MLWQSGQIRRCISAGHHGRPGSQECDSLLTHSGTNIDLMALIHYTRSAFRVLTQPSDGPTLYELCDPLLLASTPADESHLQRFYRVALAHPALRLILRRAGLPHLRDPSWCDAVRQSILAARDEPQPDWQRIGRPVADLLDKLPQHAPRPAHRLSVVASCPGRYTRERRYTMKRSFRYSVFVSDGLERARRFPLDRRSLRCCRARRDSALVNR